MTVHLSYASDDLLCLVAEELFLPESWANDRVRCHEARIPDEMVYRTKSETALEQYDCAVANGIKFSWLTFDHWYGAKPVFLRALSQRRQKFVGEVHKGHMVWLQKPRRSDRPYRKHGRGKGRKSPRLVADSRKAISVRECFDKSREFRTQEWKRWHVKDTQKGPKIVEVKHAIVFPQNDEGRPSQEHHLLVVRDIQAPNDVKYFLSNAPPATDVGTLLKVAYSRWRVERCFEDDHIYVGMDHFKGRTYPGLIRHLVLSAMALLYLARCRQDLLQSYPELTVSQVYQATSAIIQSWWLRPVDAERLIGATAYKLEYYQRRNAQARKSHTRTRAAWLESQGKDVTSLNKCVWGAS